MRVNSVVRICEFERCHDMEFADRLEDVRKTFV